LGRERGVWRTDREGQAVVLHGAPILRLFQLHRRRQERFRRGTWATQQDSGDLPPTTPAGTPFPAGVTFYTPIDRRSVDEVNDVRCARPAGTLKDKFVFS
jgi:hypothetical protein